MQGYPSRTKIKTVGGCPTASYLSCLAKKGNPKKAPPVCRRYAVPSIRNKLAGLRNSHDPLRGHVLKQCSPNITASLLLIEAAHRGKKFKTVNPDGGQQVALHTIQFKTDTLASAKGHFTMRRKCAFCESEITEINDSKEHVIPNSIGGRKKVRGFICKTCNSSFGQTWDAKLAEQLNWFSLAIGVERERRSSPDEIVQTVDGTELLLRSDGTMTRKDPFFQRTGSDGKANIRMFARTEDEARQMLQGIKKKYPEFDLEEELKSLKLQPFKVGDALQHRLELGGSEAGRSVVKTAIAQCVVLGIDAHRCEIGLHTLKTPTDDRGFVLFYLRDVVIDRPQTDLFHLVSIRGDSEKGTLLAYVEYFGAMRVMVSLSSKFEGESFTSVYALNPRSREELNLSVNWDIHATELHAAFNGFGLDENNFKLACRNAIAIASHVRTKRERHRVHHKELSAVLSQMGIPPGGIPEPKDRDKFNYLMEKELGSSLSEFLEKIPSMPEIKTK
jgi:hypothetical protein